MDDLSAYRHPSLAVRDVATSERYRDPRATTRFLQCFLTLHAAQFLYTFVLLLPGLGWHGGGAPTVASAAISVHLVAFVWSTILVMSIALCVWVWWVCRNLRALGCEHSPHPLLAGVTTLTLLSIGAPLVIRHDDALHLLLFAVIGLGAAYACHAIGMTMRFDPADGPSPWRPVSNPLATWWLLTLAQGLIPFGLMHRYLSAPAALPDQALIAKLGYYLLAAAADLALVRLAGRIATHQQRLWARTTHGLRDGKAGS